MGAVFQEFRLRVGWNSRFFKQAPSPYETWIPHEMFARRWVGVSIKRLPHPPDGHQGWPDGEFRLCGQEALREAQL